MKSDKSERHCRCTHDESPILYLMNHPQLQTIFIGYCMLLALLLPLSLTRYLTTYCIVFIALHCKSVFCLSINWLFFSLLYEQMNNFIYICNHFFLAFLLIFTQWTMCWYSISILLIAFPWFIKSNDEMIVELFIINWKIQTDFWTK